MVVRVGGRIPIRHPGRCEMGKWDKLRRRGVQGNMLLLGEGFFFLSSVIIVKVQKTTRAIKTGPSREQGGSFFTSRLVPHMSEAFCHMAL